MDSAYRYGGEEFMVILPETDLSEAKTVADRIRKSIEKEVFEPKENVSAGVTVSIGITEYCHKGGDLSKFIKRADNALYESKQKGRNCATVRKAEVIEHIQADTTANNHDFSVKNVSFSFLTHPTQKQIDQIVMLYQLEDWWTPADTYERVARIISGSHCFMIAASDDEIVGMGRAVSDKANDAYIQDVVFKKEYRKQRLGTSLLEALIRRLEADDIRWIGLIAEKNSRNFYTSLGFNPMRRAVPMVKTS